MDYHTLDMKTSVVKPTRWLSITSETFSTNKAPECHRLFRAKDKEINWPKQTNIRYITQWQFGNLLRYLERGIDLVRNEDFHNSREHFLNPPTKRTIGFNTNIDLVRAPHTPIDVDNLYSMRSMLGPSCVNPNEDNTFVELSFLEIPASTESKLKRVNDFETSYAGLEEFLHLVEEVIGKPVSKSLPNSEKDDWEFDLEVLSVPGRENDVVWFFVENNIPVPKGFFDRYKRSRVYPALKSNIIWSDTGYAKKPALGYITKALSEMRIGETKVINEHKGDIPIYLPIDHSFRGVEIKVTRERKNQFRFEINCLKPRKRNYCRSGYSGNFVGADGIEMGVILPPNMRFIERYKDKYTMLKDYKINPCETFVINSGESIKLDCTTKSLDIAIP